jgi:hypothetical protein
MGWSRDADDEGVGSPTDQPWAVFSQRPAPLADLFRSECERIGEDRSRVDGDRLVEDQPVLKGCPNGTAEPPATID